MTNETIDAHRPCLPYFFCLRRLNSGWSFHTGRPATRSASAAPSNRFSSATAAATTAATNGNQPLRDEEVERIKKVLERAQRIELLEQERVGYAQRKRKTLSCYAPFVSISLGSSSIASII